MIPRLPAWNRGCLWASLRTALAGCPALSPQLPDRAGTAFTTVPFGSRQLPVERAGRRDPQVTLTPCASAVEPDHGHPAALQIPLRAFGMRSHGEQGSQYGQ